MTSVRRLTVLICALCSAFAVAAATPDDEQNAEMTKALHRNLLRSFALDKDLKIDPELRTAAADISAAHVARIDQLFPAWLAEERQLQTKARAGKAPPANELFFAVWARLLNELALWQIEPGDADYERATLAVLQSSPRVCDVAGEGLYGDFATRIARIQAMPAAQRAAALATERSLLSRWGQAREVAAWPDPLPQDAGAQWRKRVPAAGERPMPALSPALASAMLADKKSFDDLHPQLKCALQQWWLQVSLRQGATPAAALNAFRYGTLINAIDRFAGFYDQSPADGKPAPAGVPVYPSAAARFMATGVTTMRARLDAAGKPVQATVAARKITVPGIRSVRPVAFENIFDAAAVKYALDGFRYDRPRGAEPFAFQLAWTLPDEPAVNQTKKGSQ
ncbi:hypothetical protein [Rugamonas rivuli]|uniref:TonB C-terminal domain-containing protein n=1 Tax=Rugamonas rivuli TaxID=2743358 RepID=A0A843SIA9_9BURK|nr:hypothetical protein [Rugamonas rivuli]MQA21830.1 hypothetical protein [Rugamonas rivuli]